MTVLIVGASGATGRLLVEQLLNRGINVKVIVRSTASITEMLSNKNLNVIPASLLQLSDTELGKYVQDCDAVVSCLGHNITIKGMFGHPRRLVTDAARRLCEAIIKNNPKKQVKYILMNTTGNRNRDLNEPVSFAERSIFALIRLLLPPQADNEDAADYLRTKIGQTNKIVEWTAVRPDGLTDEKNVSMYTVHPSPVRSALFNPGKTSRINVAHFMSELVSNEKIWKQWKGQMPVVYNAD